MQTNQALENEMSVIGAILLDNEAIDAVLPVLKTNDFTDCRHRLIYTAIIKLANDGAPVDLVTVTMALREAGQIEKIGDSSYLSDLVDYVPTAANVSHYAKQVRKASTRRNLEAQFSEGIRKLQHGEDVTAVRNYIDSSLLDLTMDRKGEPTHISLDLIRTIENIEAAQKNPGKINGLETHFGKFDRLTGGLRGGDLIILAGRPAMGKTALALNMAEQCSIRGKAVAFFSLEMSRAQLVERLMLGSAGVDSGRARVGKLQGNDFNTVYKSPSSGRGQSP